MPVFTCSKLTTETLEQGVKCRFGVFIVNFEHISQLILVFLLLNFSKQFPAGKVGTKDESSNIIVTHQITRSRTAATSKIEYFLTIKLHFGCHGWPRFSSLYKVARIRQQRNVEELVKTRQQQRKTHLSFFCHETFEPSQFFSK